MELIEVTVFVLSCSVVLMMIILTKLAGKVTELENKVNRQKNRIL